MSLRQRHELTMERIAEHARDDEPLKALRESKQAVYEHNCLIGLSYLKKAVSLADEGYSNRAANTARMAADILSKADAERMHNDL